MRKEILRATPSQEVLKGVGFVGTLLIIWRGILWLLDYIGYIQTGDEMISGFPWLLHQIWLGPLICLASWCGFWVVEKRRHISMQGDRGTYTPLSEPLKNDPKDIWRELEALWRRSLIFQREWTKETSNPPVREIQEWASKVEAFIENPKNNFSLKEISYLNSPFGAYEAGPPPTMCDDNPLQIQAWIKLGRYERLLQQIMHDLKEPSKLHNVTNVPHDTFQKGREVFAQYLEARDASLRRPPLDPAMPIMNKLVLSRIASAMESRATEIEESLVPRGDLAAVGAELASAGLEFREPRLPQAHGIEADLIADANAANRDTGWQEFRDMALAAEKLNSQVTKYNEFMKAGKPQPEVLTHLVSTLETPKKILALVVKIRAKITTY